MFVPRDKVTTTEAPNSPVRLTTPLGAVASADVAPLAIPMPRVKTGAPGGVASMMIPVASEVADSVLL